VFDDIQKVDSTILETNLTKVNPEYQGNPKRKRKNRAEIPNGSPPAESSISEDGQIGERAEHPLLDIRI
jgi:hypothetical protein